MVANLKTTSFGSAKRKNRATMNTVLNFPSSARILLELSSACDGKTIGSHLKSIDLDLKVHTLHYAY